VQYIFIILTLLFSFTIISCNEKDEYGESWEKKDTLVHHLGRSSLGQQKLIGLLELPPTHQGISM